MKDKTIIEGVFTREDKNASIPIMLGFQNGSLTAISKDKTRFCRVKNLKDKSVRAMFVANDQVYHGLTVSTSSEDNTDTYICVQNISSKKVRIMPIDQVNLKNHVYDELTKKSRALNASKQQEICTTESLLRTFGGRKAKRLIDNREKMTVNVDLVNTELENILEESDLIDEKDLEINDGSHYDRLRPDFNKEATKIEDIYKASNVLPTALLERLEEEAKVVYSTDVAHLPITSEYLLSCIKKIQQSTASAEHFLKIKLIIYMDSLLNLIKTRARNMKKVELSRVTEKVENDVRERFSDPNASGPFARTAFSSEKAICYFIVLALLISDKYDVDITILSKELCIAHHKIHKYAQIVNAKLVPKSNILSLRIPSKMPPLSTKSFKRSKK